ncbi:MAG: hypothetical protein ACREGR_04375 [Minisyncoccia bacterium]
MAKKATTGPAEPTEHPQIAKLRALGEAKKAIDECRREAAKAFVKDCKDNLLMSEGDIVYYASQLCGKLDFYEVAFAVYPSAGLAAPNIADQDLARINEANKEE